MSLLYSDVISELAMVCYEMVCWRSQTIIFLLLMCVLLLSICALFDV